MPMTRVLLVDDHEVVRLGLKSLLDARRDLQVYPYYCTEQLSSIALRKAIRRPSGDTVGLTSR